MASFAVDVTEVRFAATNTGYKDITITGMPQAGVSCTITGTNAPSFGYRIPGSDQNVYRVYTTSNTSIGMSVNRKTAIFRITNLADSTDSVDVSLEQLAYSGVPIVRGVKNVYDNIYAYYTNTNIPARLFAEYRTDDVGTYATLYVDGYEGTTTLSESWAYYTAESAYTDTGFKQIKIGATNNYDSAFRSCSITFPSTGGTGYTSYLYQNAYPSNTAGCTSPTLFSQNGGTEDVYTYHSTVPGTGSFDYTGYTNDGLNVTYMSKSAIVQAEEPKYRIKWEVTVGQNSTDNILRGALLFKNTSNYNIIGFTLVKQDAASGPAQTLTADPPVLSYPSSGGGRTLDVTYATSLSTNESSMPSWLSSTYVSVGSSARSYTITAASNNTSIARSFNFELADVNMSLTVPITQASGTAASLAVSPSSDTVSYPSGSVQVTVTSSGISDLNYTISDSWITSAGAPVGGVYTFNYTEKNSVGQRTGTITFYGGGLSETYTLIQNGMTQLTVSPPSELVGNTTGSVYPEVTGASNISYSISQDARSWLSYRSKVGDIFTFDYTTNESSTARTGVVTFSATGYISNTYTLTQSGASGLVANPSELTFTRTGGEQEVVVTGTGVVHLVTSNIPEWIDTQVAAGGHYYITASANTSSNLRRWDATFYDNVSTITVPVIQYGTSTPSLNISPSSRNIDSDGGNVTVTVTVTGISSSNLSYDIAQAARSWLSYVGNSGDVYTFSCTSNSTYAQRTGIVTFSATGVESKTFTVIQAGMTPGPTPVYQNGLKAYPKKLRYYKEGGNINVTFTSRPVAGIGYQITYTDGSGWLTVTDGGSYKTVTAAANSGIRRRASIKFYDLGDSSNYVILPVIQGSVDGYDSIWVDQLFYPEDRDENGNYYYRLVNQDGGYEYFVGVSTEPQGSGNVGIDIPRLVEGHLWTDFETRGTGLGWNDMQWSYFTIDVYNMTDTGWPGVVDDTFKYCNDWSRIEKRYDYTRSLNDPINCKGADNMFIPFCVYYDDAATFSIVDTEKNGSVNTYTFTSPSTPFAMRYDSFYDTKKVDYRQDGDILFSYDMTHCGPGAFIYRNRFGGWDSFLIEGNVMKTDNYTKQNWRRKGFYNNGINENLGYGPKEKITDSVDINTTYEAYTGWLTDEESARLVYHLLSSPTVYYQILDPEEINTDEQLNIIPVRLTASSAEYKKFRNGKRLVNYLITFEKGNTEKVMR